MSTRNKRRETPIHSASAWGTSLDRTFAFSTRVGGGAWSPSSTTQALIRKDKPVSGKSALVDGWRNPTPFRAYVQRQIPGPAFQYKGKLASLTMEHKGDSGYLPDASLFWQAADGAGGFPTVPINIINRATTECLNKLKNGSLNFGETIATLNQTLELMIVAVKSMRNIYKRVGFEQVQAMKAWDAARAIWNGVPPDQRLGWKRFAAIRGVSLKRPSYNWFREGGTAWLQVHYGWAPLAADIAAGMEILRTGKGRQTAHAVRNVKESYKPRSWSTTYGSASVSGRRSCGALVRADVLVDDTSLAYADSVGLVNPFQLGWELLPFSFVIDWLIPIGNALAALSASVGLTLRGISTTQYAHCDLEYVWSLYKDPQGTMPSSRVQGLSTYRTVSFFWPFPKVYIKSPYHTSTTRLVTAISLLLSDIR